MSSAFFKTAVMLCSLALVACGKKEKVAEEVPFVDVTEVVNANSTSPRSFTGKTKPASELNLAFRVSGQIVRMLVNEGDHVRAGQVVAEMDDRDYKVQLAATQAEYNQIKADAERVMALYEEGNTTASNYDKARYGLEQITQKLENHTNQLHDTKLRSTIDGYVQTRLHQSGETVSAGMPVVSLFGKNNTEVEIKISASDYANLDKFNNFYSMFSVTDEEHHPMTIVRTSQEANSSQLYTVRLRFTTPIDQKKITPGMTTMVYANLDNGEGGNMTLVPSSAVFCTGEQSQVFVYDSKSGTVSRRNVIVSGMHRNGMSEITAGVKAGEWIVSSGVHHVSEGQKVQPLQKPSKSNVGGLL